MSEEPLLLLVRHGETDANRVHRFAGWSDDPLNEEGRRQCRRLAERLEERHVDAVFSSPIRRAVESAEILAGRLGTSVRTVHDLHEIEIGVWKGLLEEEVSERWPEAFRRWRESPDEFRIEGRESLQDVLDRALEAVNQIGRARLSSPGAAAVVTHLALLRVLWLNALGQPLSRYHEVHGPNAGVFPIRWLGRGRIEPAGPAPAQGDEGGSEPTIRRRT